ncbi:MAG: preprotein translocase subunit SecG [Planctomycetota bacterium]
MTLLVRFTLGFMLVFMALFLIALVLIQRGRGGGLAGAFVGAGGQSAFGTKAGDLFTRITVVVASIWILLCILATNVLGTRTSRISPALGGAAASADATGGVDMQPAEPETKPETTPDAGAKTEPEQNGAPQPATPAGDAKSAAEPASEGATSGEPAAGAGAAQPAPPAAAPAAPAAEPAPPAAEATPPASPAAK